VIASWKFHKKLTDLADHRGQPRTAHLEFAISGGTLQRRTSAPAPAMLVGQQWYCELPEVRMQNY
jgi:hypothetical protein